MCMMLSNGHGAWVDFGSFRIKIQRAIAPPLDAESRKALLIMELNSKEQSQ